MILIPNVLFEVQKQDAGDFDIVGGAKRSRMYIKRKFFKKYDILNSEPSVWLNYSTPGSRDG